MGEEKSVSTIWATHAGGSGRFEDGQSHIDWACRRITELEAEVERLKLHRRENLPEPKYNRGYIR